MADATDDAFVAFFRQQPGAEAALAATGAAGLRRVLDVWHGRQPTPPAWDAALPGGRDRGDVLVDAIAVVARAAPGEYVAGLGGGRQPVSTLAVLGGVDHPRAVEVLAAHLRDRDWLARLAAVRSLTGRTDTASRDAIGRATGDKEPIVRACALVALRAWDPDRAAALLAGDAGARRHVSFAETGWPSGVDGVAGA